MEVFYIDIDYIVFLDVLRLIVEGKLLFDCDIYCYLLLLVFIFVFNIVFY